jgi:ferredoxin-NADP reductase
LIVNTGVIQDDGKPVKRAYSILHYDPNQQNLTLAAKRLPGGIGSNAICDLQVNADVTYSGPWGKWTINPDELPADRPVLVIATHTGISAALGLSQLLIDQPALKSRTQLVWLRPAEPYFLSDNFIRESWLGDPKKLTILDWPTPQQLPSSQQISQLYSQLSANREEVLYLVGDGAFNRAMQDVYLSECNADPLCRIENFFHKPPKA